jgi:hypothetical protein
VRTEIVLFKRTTLLKFEQQILSVRLLQKR